MADDERNIIDEEDAEAQQMRSAGLPMQWKQGATGEVVGENRLIRKATPDQVNIFTRARVRTCGDCQYFRPAAMKEQARNGHSVVRNFMARIWSEWGDKGGDYLGDSPDKLGRCKQDAEVAVGPRSLACNHYKTK